MPLDDVPKISRRALGDQIADQVREEVFLGRLKPYTAISQQSLCERYGTSRMPARDAITRLTAEGLIVTRPGGHSEIARVTRVDFQDVFEIEAIVHGRAARRACENATPDDLAVLGEYHEAMLAAESEGDLDKISDLNWRFHRRINQMAGSPKLMAVLRSVSFAIPRNYLAELPDWAATTNREHTEILAAFRAGDTDAVERSSQDHVREAGEGLVAYLETKGLFEDAAMDRTA